MTGLRVTSTQPVFIQAGCSWGWNSQDSNYVADHRCDYVPAVNKLGTRYVIVPTPNYILGDIVRLTGLYTICMSCMS